MKGNTSEEQGLPAYVVVLRIPSLQTRFVQAIPRPRAVIGPSLPTYHLRRGLVSERTKRLVKCFVRSVALYGAETWTLRQSEEKRIEAFKCGMDKDGVCEVDSQNQAAQMVLIELGRYFGARELSNSSPESMANWSIQHRVFTIDSYTKHESVVHVQRRFGDNRDLGPVPTRKTILSWGISGGNQLLRGYYKKNSAPAVEE
ncbi:hypothetical protein ANN_17189 [Periplaneta americana]|uniref:Per a allergen n=1 Tax=Periplaneta americana TaxID=6978 RepID=A0ABQ8SS80_PERAM|nr:hypothetical protein ANN_17189 [Periplaneta americana]